MQSNIGAWYEEGGLIRFSVTSDGTTGEEWIERIFKRKELRVPKYPENLLLSEDFQPTNGVTTQAVVYKGGNFGTKKGIFNRIRERARRDGFENPNAEVACLIAEKFSQKQIAQMGLFHLEVVHTPFVDSDGIENFLGVIANKGDYNELGCYRVPDIVHYPPFYKVAGFVFAVP